MPLKVGTPVRQVVPVIEGTVRKAVYDDATEKFSYLVEFEAPGGETGERWFAEDEVEAAPVDEENQVEGDPQ